MKLRKRLKKNEIYFTVVSSTALSIMAIIISYYTYKISSRQTSIIEFEATPDFVITKEKVGTDSMHFKISYEDKKFKNLKIQTYLVFDLSLDSVSAVYENDTSISGSRRVMDRRYEVRSSYRQSYDFKNNSIIISQYSFLEKQLQFTKDKFNEKFLHKEKIGPKLITRGLQLNIRREILFVLQYSTYLNKKIVEIYSTDIYCYNDENRSSSRIVAHLDFESVDKEKSKFYKGSKQKGIHDFFPTSEYNWENNLEKLYKELMN